MADLGPMIRGWALECGFASCGVADVDLSDAEPGLLAWLAAGMHGTMDYMERHGVRRARPAELVPGTVRAIMVSADYAPADADWVERAWLTLADGERAFVARYALGRDYHKVVRARLQRLAQQIAATLGPFGHRVFCDSAPVMEVELARRAGLGWRGKHTLLLHPRQGSTFFLGTLYVDLPLLLDAPTDGHCGTCERCLEVCPTRAIVAPYRLDARRCISYLTIEHKGAIPVEFRAPIGNRIFGCDDCQLACPWNKFAQRAELPALRATDRTQAGRQSLEDLSLVAAFSWSEDDFWAQTAGSAIRRIGYERWMRNVAIALGNADATPTVLAALRSRLDDPSALVREHVAWALDAHESRSASLKLAAQSVVENLTHPGEPGWQGDERSQR